MLIIKECTYLGAITTSRFYLILGDDIGDIKLIMADVKDEESLKSMTSQAKVIVNCCGPYRFYGEPVIKACVETGTHHVDVSGEPQVRVVRPAFPPFDKISDSSRGGKTGR